MTSASDPLMDRIVAVVAQAQGGDREQAHASFTELWQEIGPQGDPLHRCVTAHYMADICDRLEDELEWDRRALAAAEGLSEARLKQYQESWTLDAFCASLHLNLAEDYRRLNFPIEAVHHLLRADASAASLDDSGLGGFLRRGIGNLRQTLAQTFDQSLDQAKTPSADAAHPDAVAPAKSRNTP